MSALKASQSGLGKIRQAIDRTGRRMGDEVWLLEASKILEPDGNWQAGGPYAYGCSQQTWERFLKGVPIRDRSFAAFCQVLELDPQEIAEARNQLCVSGKDVSGESDKNLMISVSNSVSFGALSKLRQITHSNSS